MSSCHSLSIYKNVIAVDTLDLAVVIMVRLKSFPKEGFHDRQFQKLFVGQQTNLRLVQTILHTSA